MSITIIFSVIGAVVSLSSILIGIGVVKGKINQNTDINAAQTKEIETRATKNELAAAVTRANEQLAAAIKRSDEMLAIMTKRAEEDRAHGEGKYREFYSLLNGHGERIAALETQQNVLNKSLDEIKTDLKTGLKDIQSELKELNKKG
ncbi:MAG: hypothetical protein LBN21_04225 [Treponema sp.]|jgi:hypothetical protein|nr:hypothetical protein [Treponema sp.]